MTAWFRSSPGLVRAGALLVGVIATSLCASYLGQTINWETAVIVGVTLGVSMRWPLVFRETGMQVILPLGLFLAVLIQYGLFTALILKMFDFFTRMIATRKGPYYWEWYRPVSVFGTTTTVYGVYWLISRGIPEPHPTFPYLDGPSLVLVFGYWWLLSFILSSTQVPRPGLRFSQEYLLRMQQTWWVPLAYLAVANMMAFAQSYGTHWQVLFCLAILWIQSRVAPVFSALNQDRAVSELALLLDARTDAQHVASQRVMRMAHHIGKAVPLSRTESRLVGYAAILQDLPGSDPQIPLWYANPPGPDELDRIRNQVDRAKANVERDGSLRAVAALLHYRYASYDGKGYPAVAGDTIPLSAQVLAAANAVVTVLMHLDTDDSRRAVEWIRTHAASRFHPTVLRAMDQAFLEANGTQLIGPGLRETVQQLQGLVGEGAAPSDLVTGLRRVWAELRGQIKLAPGLPAEVQAMARLSNFFAAGRDTALTAQTLVDAVGQLVGGKVLLALMDGADHDMSMYFQATYGLRALTLEGRRIAVRAGEMSRAVLNQEPVQVPDLREANSTLALEIARVEGIRSVLYVPLVRSGRTIGLLMVCMQRYHWFTPREVGLIHLVAGQAATALENARLMAQVAERYEHISALKSFTDTLLDNLNSSIVVLDSKGLVTLVNAASRELFGPAYQLEVGQPLPEELWAACPAQSALEGEGCLETDVDLGSATLEVQSAPLRDSSGILLGAICLARDVTKVRAMQQQVRRVEKLAAIGELAAGAAHEIRNPLTSIRGFIQLTQARASGSESEFFQIVLNEIDRIDGIIRDLLLLARPSEFQRQVTALPPLLDEVLLLLHGEFQRQGISVAKEIDPTVGRVPLDAKMFRQLLLNLLINARQAMPFGGRLTVVVRRVDSDHVALDVRDTGVGITTENVKRLFVPFFTTKEGGTGLGLALCYSIVQAHQGRIDVDSVTGQGTTFTITLPTDLVPTF